MRVASERDRLPTKRRFIIATPLWAERRFTSSCTEVINATGQLCGAPIPKGKRKCAKHLKVKKRTQGKAVNKGRNATGIAAHKPAKSYTRHPKGQYEKGGDRPTLSSTRWDWV